MTATPAWPDAAGQPVSATARKTGGARVMIASLVGTTIEFYDYYVYGLATSLVIGTVFFPNQSDPRQATLLAFLTFGLAFVARPIGSAVFGHFGDRVGRKSTLVASLLFMGVSTVLIGCVPGYDRVGFVAPVLLCLLRFGQGIGLGGEWAGAALLATENAPAGRRGWYGMFPQMGPPIGYLIADGLFLILNGTLSRGQFVAWGWRLPFLLSAALIALGLYVRLNLTETPAFSRAAAHGRRVRLPLMEALRHHWRAILLGSLAMVVCYVLFYVSTVFALTYGNAVRHLPMLKLLLVAILGMAVTTPLAGLLVDRFGRRPVLVAASLLTAASGFAMPSMLGEGGAVQVTLFLTMELALMGLTFAPMGALLPELFPTRVRYTGASAAYNIGGILGGSLALYISQTLLAWGGLAYVGYYVTAAAAISALAVLLLRETAEDDIVEYE